MNLALNNLQRFIDHKTQPTTKCRTELYCQIISPSKCVTTLPDVSCRYICTLTEDTVTPSGGNPGIHC